MLHFFFAFTNRISLTRVVALYCFYSVIQAQSLILARFIYCGIKIYEINYIYVFIYLCIY